GRDQLEQSVETGVDIRQEVYRCALGDRADLQDAVPGQGLERVRNERSGNADEALPGRGPDGPLAWAPSGPQELLDGVVEGAHAACHRWIAGEDAHRVVVQEGRGRPHRDQGRRPVVARTAGGGLEAVGPPLIRGSV